MSQSLTGDFWLFGLCGAGFGAGLWAPFSNFHFGVPQTGSIVDRDRFAECPSGATLAQLTATRSFLILCLLQAIVSGVHARAMASSLRFFDPYPGVIPRMP